MGRVIKQDDSKMGKAIKQKFQWGGPQNKSSSGEGRNAKVRAGRVVKQKFRKGKKNFSRCARMKTFSTVCTVWNFNFIIQMHSISLHMKW